LRVIRNRESGPWIRAFSGSPALTRLSPVGDRRVILRYGEEACVSCSFPVPCFKGGSTMEPRQSEKSLESRSEVPTSASRQPERKRRFQIVKLEERIAPGKGGNGK